MVEESSTVSMVGSKAVRAILIGGFVAGVLDITAAFVVGYKRRGLRPIDILHAVASGLLGPKSYEGGKWTAILGLALHFLIAFSWCVIYYMASRKLNFLLRYAVVSGLLYGVVVFFFMNMVVLPLSAVTFKVSFATVPLIIGLSTIMLCIGLPISLIIRKYST